MPFNFKNYLCRLKKIFIEILSRIILTVWFIEYFKI